MKHNSGVTLSSLIIYVIAMAIVIGTIATLTKYFYGNIDSLSVKNNSAKEYTMFSSYFTNDINQPGIQVITEESNDTKIIFTNGNQYAYLGDQIYFNKILICRNVSNCVFTYNEATKEVTAKLTISGKQYTNTYKLV